MKRLNEVYYKKIKLDKRRKKKSNTGVFEKRQVQVYLPTHGQTRFATFTVTQWNSMELNGTHVLDDLRVMQFSNCTYLLSATLNFNFNFIIQYLKLCGNTQVKVVQQNIPTIDE